MKNLTPEILSTRTVDPEHWDDTVIVALGSNLGGEYGSSAAALKTALLGFPENGLIVKAKSALWRSQAWPDPTQPNYLNAVAVVETGLDPAQLMAVLHAMEARAGRQRISTNDSRVLDLDLIAFGRQVTAGPGLILPHPRAADRRFVMGPLAEIAPGWRHPVSGATAQTLAEAASVGRDAAPLPGGAWSFGFGVAQNP